MLDRGEDRGPVFHDAASEFHERGDAATAGPADPFVECFACFIDRKFEDDAEAFFQVVGPAEGGVCLHNAGELDFLLRGENLRGLPKRIAGVLHPGGAGAIRARGVSFGGRPGCVWRRPVGRLCGHRSMQPSGLRPGLRWPI